MFTGYSINEMRNLVTFLGESEILDIYCGQLLDVELPVLIMCIHCNAGINEGDRQHYMYIQLRCVGFYEYRTWYVTVFSFVSRR